MANYPRVLISKTLYSQIESGIEWHFVVTDLDGQRHLNYFGWLVTYRDEKDKRIKWRDDVLAKTTDNIKKLENENSLKELAKWIWFKSNVEFFISVVNKTLSSTNLKAGRWSDLM